MYPYPISLHAIKPLFVVVARGPQITQGRCLDHPRYTVHTCQQGVRTLSTPADDSPMVRVPLFQRAQKFKDRIAIGTLEGELVRPVSRNCSGSRLIFPAISQYLLNKINLYSFLNGNSPGNLYLSKYLGRLRTLSLGRLCQLNKTRKRQSVHFVSQ